VTNDRIEQGVALYGFNEEYVVDPDYQVESAFRDLQRLGVKKCEFIGAMFFDNYPRPTTAEIDRVLAAADAYGAEIFSYAGYSDIGKVTGHTPADEDFVLALTADLLTARDLGCRQLKTFNIPVHLLSLVAMFGEQYDINIGIEVHAPSKPSDANIQGMLAEMDRIDSPRVGFVPDFGCFIERPAKPAVDRYVREGADPQLIEYIIANRHSGMSEDELFEDVSGRGGGQAERMAIADFFGFLSFGPADVEGFASLLPRSHFFHSKFYHVTEQLEDATIPLDQLLAAIVASGFEGVLLSEYEGHAFRVDDAYEQIDRHLRLEQRILAELGRR
jgi:sugar phosphate isomerase/epimerase